MIDKNFCMSSYLAFRYIEKEDIDFKEGFHHSNIKAIPDKDKIICYTSDDIDKAIKEQLNKFEGKKLGLLLSGGMDSACLASYMKGCDAYTFRFLNGEYQKEELQRAEKYAETNNMKLHYVDINWDTVEKYVDDVMKHKGAPVHSIEPQILQAAIQAKEDGIEIMVTGASSDLIFGGMDKLLSKDWTYNDFVKRYTFLEPSLVLNDPINMDYLFDRYKKGDSIDFLKFMKEISRIECSSSYYNAFATANIDYIDPYYKLKTGDPLDLKRVRNGESKYLIRELFKKCYPEIPVPEKIPMPRPVDKYFENWEGPKRPEFKQDIDMNNLSGNQKWQLWCLERFLNNNNL